MAKFPRISLQESFIEIIRKTSVELPADVVSSIQAGKSLETPGSRGEYAMNIIDKNISLAKVKSQPLCQDTGSVLFYVHYPAKMDVTHIEKELRRAVVVSTKKGYLRQNSVDSLTGKNSGNNLGPGTPTIHIEPWKGNKGSQLLPRKEIEVRLILKGGGCENVGAQYSLPDGRIGAGRDLQGVRKCILDAVHQAQGKGCGPGILGVTIGGDRSTGYALSKEMFLRKLDDKNRNPELAALEEQCCQEANSLGIGPMGFGGKATLLGVKIGVLNRLPASFFVTVSYMCWAYRRQGAILDQKGMIKKWLY